MSFERGGKFSEVTLLITHYNRSASLQRELRAFESLSLKFGEVVVADDGSDSRHLSKILELQQRFDFRLITSDQNRGLGHNINKGQDAVVTPYTLYVQEDFVPTQSFPSIMENALAMLKEDHDLDIIRFFSYFPYPYTRPFRKGFLEMLFNPAPWFRNHLKFYVYSDSPHLRRSDFLQKFGRYAEGLPGDKTELSMALTFLKKRGRGLIYNDVNASFEHLNSPDEPSTMGRSSWRQSQHPLVRSLRALYLPIRLFRDTWQYLVAK